MLFLTLYKARYYDKFLGSLTAEVLKREVLAVTRAVERRVQRTVNGSAHVDVLPHVNVRVALLRCRMALQESVVVLPVAHQHAPVILTQFCHSVCAQECLNIHAQVCVA